MLSFLTTRILGYLLAASCALGVISTGWQWVGKHQALTAAETAIKGRADAIAQSQVLGDKLALQNAAVRALAANLAARQDAVDVAQESARMASAASRQRIVTIRTVKVPADCTGAMNSLADYLDASSSAQATRSNK